MKKQVMKNDSEETSPIDPQDAAPQATTQEQQVRMRAYELYLQRGMSDGHELEDWLQAEQEILGRPALTMAKAA